MTCKKCFEGRHVKCGGRNGCTCGICSLRSYPRSSESAAREKIRKAEESRKRRSQGRSAPKNPRPPKPPKPVEPLKARFVFPPYETPRIPEGADVREVIRTAADNRVVEIMFATGGKLVDIESCMGRAAARRVYYQRNSDTETDVPII